MHSQAQNTMSSFSSASMNSAVRHMKNDSLRNDLEKFVCFLYGSSSVQNVNGLRNELFKGEKFDEEVLPPTYDSLQLHIDRSNYQASCVAFNFAEMRLPPFDKHGWRVFDRKLEVKWTTQPIAPKAILDFVSCACKTGCEKRCSCTKAGLKCSELCKCTGCKNTENDISDIESEWETSSCESESDNE